MYESLQGEGLDVADRKLKALDLVTKVTLAQLKVKPESPNDDGEIVAKARKAK